MTWNIILSIVKGLKIQNFMKAVSHWLRVWQSNDIDAHNVFSDSCTYTCSVEFHFLAKSALSYHDFSDIQILFKLSMYVLCNTQVN